MLEKNEINHIARYSVLKRSGEMNKIVIWPELPYWLMVNEAAVKLIDNVEGKNLKQIVEAAQDGMDEKIKSEEVEEFLECLQSVGVVWQGKNEMVNQEIYFANIAILKQLRAKDSFYHLRSQDDYG